MMLRLKESSKSNPLPLGVGRFCTTCEYSSFCFLFPIFSLISSVLKPQLLLLTQLFADYRSHNHGTFSREGKGTFWFQSKGNYSDTQNSPYSEEENSEDSDKRGGSEEEEEEDSGAEESESE